MNKQSAAPRPITEHPVYKTTETLYRHWYIPVLVFLLVTSFLIGTGVIIWILVNDQTLSTINRLLITGLAVLFLGIAVFVRLYWYPIKAKSGLSQKIILAVGFIELINAGLINFLVGSTFLMIVSFVAAIAVLTLLVGRTKSWGGAMPQRFVFFYRSISVNYRTNLVRQEMIFVSMVIAGFFFQSSGFEIAGQILFWIGGFGIVFAPIFALAPPPTGFLSKTPTERKGMIERSETFRGAIYGSSFLGRTGIAAESVDNALFATNKRLLCITLGGLVTRQEDEPLFKGLQFKYLEERGREWLRKTPQAVLDSHSFNFSLAFEDIEQVTFVTNPLLALLGINVVSVAIPGEGMYRFRVQYADQFEKLKSLLDPLLPGKIGRATWPFF